MATLDIRQPDDDAVKRFEQRAAGNRRSPEREVRHISEGATRSDPRATRGSFRAFAGRLRRATEGRVHTPCSHAPPPARLSRETVTPLQPTVGNESGPEEPITMLPLTGYADRLSVRPGEDHPVPSRQCDRLRRSRRSW